MADTEPVTVPTFTTGDPTAMNVHPRHALTVTILALALPTITGCTTDDPEPTQAPDTTEATTQPADALPLSQVHQTLDEPVAELTYATTDINALTLCTDLFGTPEEIASWLNVDQVTPLVTGSGYELTYSPVAEHRGCAWQERPFLPADPLLVNTPEYLSADTATTIEARYTQAGPGVVCYIVSARVATDADGSTVDGVTVDCQLGPGLVYAYPEPELAPNQDDGAVIRLEPISQTGKDVYDRLPELEARPFERATLVDDLTLDTVTADESDLPDPEPGSEDLTDSTAPDQTTATTNP